MLNSMFSFNHLSPLVREIIAIYTIEQTIEYSIFIKIKSLNTIINQATKFKQSLKFKK